MFFLGGWFFWSFFLKQFFFLFFLGCGDGNQGDMLWQNHPWGLMWCVFFVWWMKQNQTHDGSMGRTVYLPTLRILGPSNAGVGTCIAGVRVLKIGTFEGSGYLGYMKTIDFSHSWIGKYTVNRPMDRMGF